MWINFLGHPVYNITYKITSLLHHETLFLEVFLLFDPPGA